MGGKLAEDAAGSPPARRRLGSPKVSAAARASRRKERGAVVVGILSTRCCHALPRGVCLAPLGWVSLLSEGLESAGGLRAAAEARSCGASYRCLSPVPRT